MANTQQGDKTINVSACEGNVTPITSRSKTQDVRRSAFVLVQKNAKLINMALCGCFELSAGRGYISHPWKRYNLKPEKRTRNIQVLRVRCYSSK
jgi:hypothetical protein